MGEKFISDLVEGIESTFTKFAGDTEVSGGVDKSEDEAVSWIELDKLEEWANKNIWSLTKSSEKSHTRD